MKKWKKKILKEYLLQIDIIYSIIMDDKGKK